MKYIFNQVLQFLGRKSCSGIMCDQVYPTDRKTSNAWPSIKASSKSEWNESCNKAFLFDVHMVNIIPASTLNTPLFFSMCQELGSKQKVPLLFYIEIHCLLRGNVVAGLESLRKELTASYNMIIRQNSWSSIRSYQTAISFKSRSNLLEYFLLIDS